MISSGSTILSLDALERIDQLISRGPFTHILLSPNGRFLALITATGLLWVVSSDFARSLSEVYINDMGARDEGDRGGVPDRVEWCGDNAVVLAWGGSVVVVGPAGETLKSADLFGVSRMELMARTRYEYPKAAFLLGELDGLRIISSTSYDSMQKVPGQQSRIYRRPVMLIMAGYRFYFSRLQSRLRSPRRNSLRRP